MRLTSADGHWWWNGHSVRQWVRACLRISQDRHLRTGGVFDWGQISRAAD